jgi:hypothetical protein
MVLSGNARRPRPDASGEDYLVKTLFHQHLHRGTGVQMQMNAGQFYLAAVVAQRFVKLLFAGNVFGHVELPANVAPCLEQVYFVAPLCSDGGGRKSGRASSHHGDFLFDFCG